MGKYILKRQKEVALDQGHKDVCRKREFGESATTEHAWNHHHLILWEVTSVIDRASKWKEALHCHNHDVDLDPTY